MTGVIVPVENAAEAAVVEGLQVIPVENLRQAIQATRRSLSFFERFKTAWGTLSKPLKLDFPPGEFYAGQDGDQRRSGASR
jgi:predicted ATPase with chaperone activity